MNERKWVIVASAVVAGALAAGSLLIAAPAGTRPSDPAPAGVGAASASPSYVGRKVCAACHAAEAKEWTGSHHDLAMQEAGAETVLGDFNNATLSHRGVTSIFYRRGEAFYVKTEGPDGRLHDYEIAYTFGADPLQQYLVAFPNGRYQALSLAWDARPKDRGGQRWFHLYPDERIAHDDPLHWTGRFQNWNSRCAACHSTDLRKNYDLEANAFATTWSEIDVSCEACHGPGKAHVEWAEAFKAGKAANPGDRRYAGKGLMVDFKSAGSRGEVEACARCHARRHGVGAGYRHGRPFLDNFMPALLRPGLYHADGQIDDEVYVYGSFVQSKMYHAGVRCTDCHEPHSAKPRAEGNALCVRCHGAQPDTRFERLKAKNYDTPAHHFHKVGSSGAQCVNCHMPATTYMVVDSRRDHSFRIPRPDLSVKFATPNACTSCHADKSAQWASDAVAKWYGPKRRQEPHFAGTIAAGRAGDPNAARSLVKLAGDTVQPAIVRATALNLLRRYGRAGARAHIAALKDQDPLVRATAIGGLESAQPRMRRQLLAPLLNDPIRAVRIEAARVLSSTPPGASDPRGLLVAFERASREFKEAQMAIADRPEAHLNLGVVNANLGRLGLAEQAYKTALRLDEGFLPARFNLANLYNRIGRNRDAERVLREGLERFPDQGELHYSLGLLLAEEKRLKEAAESLGRAAALMPERPRVHYNHGLSLQKIGRFDEAETAMLKAHQLSPDDPGILQALAIFYMQRRQWDRALIYAERLVLLYPNVPGPRQLLNQIRRLRAQ